LEFEAQPAMTTPMVVIELIASTKNTPRSRSAKNTPGASGKAVIAATIAASTSAGASMNSARSASRGTMSSLSSSFTPSATDCSQPCQPVYIGP
jgi:hypothetical protein